nr:lysine-rich arabinogalactan protein 19-like [Penaeus vannamei]
MSLPHDIRFYSPYAKRCVYAASRKRRRQQRQAVCHLPSPPAFTSAAPPLPPPTTIRHTRSASRPLLSLVTTSIDPRDSPPYAPAPSHRTPISARAPPPASPHPRMDLRPHHSCDAGTRAHSAAPLIRAPLPDNAPPGTVPARPPADPTSATPLLADLLAAPTYPPL